MPETPYRPSRRIQRPSGSMAPIDQDELDRQLALRDVMEYTVRTTRAVMAARPIRSYRWRPIVLAIISIPSVLLALYSAVGRPAFIHGPDPASVSRARQEANTRFAMYLVTQRVLDYRVAHGRWPESLESMGEDWAGISLHQVNDSVFEVRGRADSVTTFQVRSDQRMDAFLGQSVNLIRRRRP